MRDVPHDAPVDEPAERERHLLHAGELDALVVVGQTHPRVHRAPLIKRLPNTPYRILPLSKIVRARVAIYGEDDDQWGPASVYDICDVQDGNYVLVDVARQENGRHPLVDGYHEAWPDPKYCGPVASSFAEFLEQVLRTRRNLYWLGE